MKNKPKKIIIILIIAVLVVLPVSCAVVFIIHNSSYDSTDLSLDSFQSDGEYQFMEIKWGASSVEVGNNLPYTLKRDTDKKPLPDNVAYYLSQNMYLLDGQSSYASFEFYNDELRIVTLSFKFDDNHEQWFENLVNELTRLYGKENNRTENENFSASGQLKSIGYKWETDNTMLQIILMTGDTIEPAVTIGIGAK